MIFGIIVLIFSLFYFAQYARKNFNKIMQENNHLKDTTNGSMDENIQSEDTKDTLSMPLNV